MTHSLVTGAGGFVGANLVRRLLAEGHRVTGLTRPGSECWRLEGVFGELEVLEVDLRDSDALSRTVLRARPDLVFHLAARGAYSWQRDLGEMLAVNVRATATLLDAARRAGAGGVVHAGSSSEYGDKDHPPREDEILDPASHYAVTKAAATHLCRHAARTEGVATTTLRLYSVYGPWEEPARLIPTLLSHALRGELPPLVSPRTVRDFVFVEDACDAFLRAGARAAEPTGAVFNVGSGRQTTLEELVKTTRALFHVEAEPRWGTMDARSWDTATWVADPRAAQDALGWAATTSLADGLRSTAKWLRQRPARRDYT